MSKADGHALNKAEKTARAIEMRKLGYTFRRIGRELGMAHTTAHKYVHAELQALKEQNQEATSEYRELQIQRLEGLLTQHYPQAMKGHLGSTEKTLKIIQQLTDLMGTAAPKKLATTNKEGDEDAPNGIIVVPAVAGSVEEWLQQHNPDQ